MSQTSQAKQVSSQLNSVHVILPMILGLAVALYMFVSEFSHVGDNPVSWGDLLSNPHVWIFVLLAFVVVACRDYAGMWRLNHLADGRLSLHSQFRVRMLYEFTSAITPSVAGGSTLEMLYINKEGISFGESTAITIISIFLDEIVYVIFFPIVLLIIPFKELFAVGGVFSAGIVSLFLIGYAMKFIWTSILFCGIFIKPSVITWCISSLFSLKLLRKWRVGALRTAVDIRSCSRSMRDRSLVFWIKAFASSFVICLCRYSIANCLIMAFNPALSGFASNFLMMARQYVMLVVMMVAPTPGGSGFVEVMFKTYLGEFLPQGILAVLVMSLWRIIFYYNYLFIGMILAPRWISRNFGKKS